MGIGNQVGGVSNIVQQRPEYFPMTIGRLGNPNIGTSQPFFNLFPSLHDRFRPLKNPGIGNQTNKGQQTGPWKSDGRLTIELAIQPLPRHFMLGKRRTVSVNKKVCVDKNHLNLSPSASSRAPPISSRPPIRQRPNET